MQETYGLAHKMLCSSQIDALFFKIYNLLCTFRGLYRYLSGKLRYLQHNCAGDTLVYH